MKIADALEEYVPQNEINQMRNRKFQENNI